MIEIKNISKSYGSFLAIDDLSLNISDGEILGLVGINGAGKSTLMRILCGIFKADEGSILIDGEEVYENEQVKANIFFLPDEPYYDNSSTAMSLAMLYKKFYDFDIEEYIRALYSFGVPVEKPIKDLSKGMKRQIFVSLAVAIKPKYLFLDESFDGLDPLARLKLKRMLADLVVDKKSTIVISSHSLRELSDICSSFALIKDKRILTSGNINASIEKVHKYQVAFKEHREYEDFKEAMPIQFGSEGRVCRLVTALDYESFSMVIKPLEPILIDEVEIDFEELFLIMVEKGGDLYE